MKRFITLIALATTLMATPAKAETIECTVIDTIPFIITVQGIYCLRGNLASSLTSGDMITVATNNVTIDMNGFKLGGLAAGAGTNANGIFALNRRNITIRNGSIRGFLRGIFLDRIVETSSGHLLEDLRLDGNRRFGARVHGTGNIIRNNLVVYTGPSDNSISAFGLYIIDSNDSVVEGNVISSVSGTSESEGIRVQESSLIEVRNNTVLRTEDATSNFGIGSQTSTAVTIIGNRILNPAGTGTVGINDNGTSTGVNCIDNIIAGYTTAIEGGGNVACDFEAGNLTP